jgi:hypothetical protein
LLPETGEQAEGAASDGESKEEEGQGADEAPKEKVHRKIFLARGKGGGKNAQHANEKKREQAEKKYNEWKTKYEELNAKPNKTPEDKKERDKAKRQMDHWKKKMDFTGENHSQVEKG